MIERKKCERIKGTCGEILCIGLSKENKNDIKKYLNDLKNQMQLMNTLESASNSRKIERIRDLSKMKHKIYNANSCIVNVK